MNNNTSSTLDLRRPLRALRRGWPLYLFALALMLALATYYACNKQDIYKIRGTVLIEDEKESAAGMRMAGGMAQMMRTFSIGGFSSNVDNEWLVMSSHDVRERAVKALGLNSTYVERTGWLTKRLMYHDSPVLADAPDAYFDTLPRSWQIVLHLHDGKADITSTQGRFASAYWSVKDVTLPCSVKTPYGNLQLLKTEHYDANKDMKMFINLASNNEMAAWLHKHVTMEVTSKKGDAISLTIKDNRERGIDIINALIAAYNEKRTDRRSEKAQAEVDFVTQRLAALQQELAESEGKVTRFKQAAGVNNPMLEAQGWLKHSTQAQADASQAQAELSVYEMILSTLRGSDGDAMLPSFDGVKDPAITQYNELVARRSTLAQSASAGNAALEALDQQIKPLCESIIKRAEKNIEAARIKLNAIYTQAGRTQGKYNQMPAAEQQYYDLLRDRELKNDLYVFLLEKKESSLLKLGSNVSPSFILDNAYSAIKPDKTKVLVVFAIALLLALLVPTLLLLWLQHRRDLIVEPCDLPNEYEQRATLINDDVDWTNLLTKVVAPQSAKVLVLCDPSGQRAGETLTQIERLGFDCRKEQIDNVAAIHELVPAGSQVVVVEIPDWREAAAYLNQTATDVDSDVLIVLAPRGITRREFARHLAAIGPDHCHIAMLSGGK